MKYRASQLAVTKHSAQGELDRSTAFLFFSSWHPQISESWTADECAVTVTVEVRILMLFLTAMWGHKHAKLANAGVGFHPGISLEGWKIGHVRLALSYPITPKYLHLILCMSLLSMVLHVYLIQCYWDHCDTLPVSTILIN